MSDRPHKKNHTPPGTPPNRPHQYKPGRNRPARWYRNGRWDAEVAREDLWDERQHPTDWSEEFYAWN